MADGDGTDPQGGNGGQTDNGDTGGQQAPESGQDPQGGTSDRQTPPWGSDDQFDPDKAWRLIQNLRGDLDKAKTDRDDLKGKVDEHDRAKLSDQEKLTADRDGYKTRAEQAEGQLLRMEVASAKGLTPAQAKRLQGSTKEELEADADDLLASFGSNGSGTSGPPSNRPREQYRGGTSDPGEAPEETDPAKLAAAIGKAQGGGFRPGR